MFKVVVIDLSDNSVTAEIEGDAVIASAAKIDGNVSVSAATHADPFTIAKAIDGTNAARRDLIKQNPLIGIACSVIGSCEKEEVRTDEP